MLKVNDKVVLDPNKKTGFVHFFTPQTIGTVYEIRGKQPGGRYGVRATIKWIDSDRQHRTQIVPVSELIKLPNKNSSRLSLVRAEFRDSEGRKVTVKRSPCRHYYMKVEGQNQQRVSLKQVKKVVSDVR